MIEFETNKDKTITARKLDAARINTSQIGAVPGVPGEDQYD
ncbi:MAG: hypothetical protein WCY11_02525 [Novosphingobium sp.]